MDNVEIECVEIENIGKVKLDISKVPFKRYKELKKLLKDQETAFEGIIELLSWCKKDNGELAFSEEYLDELSMEKASEIYNKITEKMSQAVEETKKK